MLIKKIEDILGKEETKYLLSFKPSIELNNIRNPKKFLENKKFSANNNVLKNLAYLYNSGRLSKSGYLAIFPIDHGIEHGALDSFKNNINFFDSEYLFNFAINNGFNAIVAPFSLLKFSAKKFIDKIPFIVKLNHNDSLNSISKQNFYSSVEDAYELGASGVGATIYFGDETSAAEEVAKAFALANKMGMFTILWAYLRKPNIDKNDNFHFSAEATSQANYVASIVGADIIKQKMPKISLKKDMHPIDMVRLQLLHSSQGSIPLLNSGGNLSNDDLGDLVSSALINKLAGGAGLMPGRKIINSKDRIMDLIYEIYLSNEIEAI